MVIMKRPDEMLIDYEWFSKCWINWHVFLLTGNSGFEEMIWLLYKSIKSIDDSFLSRNMVRKMSHFCHHIWKLHNWWCSNSSKPRGTRFKSAFLLTSPLLLLKPCLLLTKHSSVDNWLTGFIHQSISIDGSTIEL